MRMKRQSDTILEEEEEVGETSTSASHCSASFSSCDDAMIDENEEETKQYGVNAKEAV